MDSLEVILSTNGEELAELTARVPGSPVFLRCAPELAGDQVKKVTVIRDYLLRAEGRRGTHFDAMVMLDTGILNIDSEEDHLLIQVIAEHLFNQYPEFGKGRSRG